MLDNLQYSTIRLSQRKSKITDFRLQLIAMAGFTLNDLNDSYSLNLIDLNHQVNSIPGYSLILAKTFLSISHNLPIESSASMFYPAP